MIYMIYMIYIYIYIYLFIYIWYIIPIYSQRLTLWSQSSLRLLMAITGGLSWNDALTPLRSVSEIVTRFVTYV